MAQNSLFPKDALNTNLTAPVSNVQVQGAVNTSLTTQTRSAGIQNFTESLSALARKKLANTIHNDTITAELAAAYDKEMPGNLDPLAQLAFSLSVDRKTQAQGINSLDEYSKIEGAAFLNDERVPRLQRMANFKNGALQLLNATKGSISNINAKEIFSGLDTAFSKLVSGANTSLALDKKQEDLSVNASAISSAVKAQLSIVQALSPEISKNSINGQPLSAEAFVSKHRTFTADWIGKSVNSKFFNGIVNDILKTKTGASVEDVKATTLGIIANELLQMAASNPELVKEEVISNLLNTVNGSTKGSTLASEIASRSDDGKVLDTIVNNFNTHLATTLANIDKQNKAARKDTDNEISNNVIDNFAKLSEAEATDLAITISDFATQLKIMTAIRTHYKDGPKLDAGTPAFNSILSKTKDYLVGGKMTTKAKADILAEGSRNNLSSAAITTLISMMDPETAIGKQRNLLKSNMAITTLKSNFKSIMVTALERSKLAEVAKKYGGIDITNETQLALFKKDIGGISISNEAKNILKAELQFSSFLENLITINPEADVQRDLVPLATAEFNRLQSSIFETPSKPIQPTDAKGSPVEPILEKPKAPVVSSSESGSSTFKLPTLEEARATFSNLVNKQPEAAVNYIDVAQKKLDKAEEIRNTIRKANGLEPTSVAERAKAIIAVGGTSATEMVTNREAVLLQHNPEAARILDARKSFLNEPRQDELLRVGSFTIDSTDVRKATDKIGALGDKALALEDRVWNDMANFFDGLRVFPKREDTNTFGLSEDIKVDVKEQTFREFVAKQEQDTEVAKFLKGRPVKPVEKNRDSSLKSRVIDKASDIKPGFDIAFGHKITKEQLDSGIIHGIVFIKDGKLIPISPKDQQLIFVKDLAIAKEEAIKDFNSADVGVSFDALPESFQRFLTDIQFNTSIKVRNYTDALKLFKTLQTNESNSLAVFKKFETEIKERKGAQTRSNEVYADLNVKADLLEFFNITK